MNVKIRLVGWLQKFRDQETIAMPHSLTVGDLLTRLPQVFGKGGVFQNIEELSSNSLILVNDRDIGVLDGFQSSLMDGDTVTIIPISHGG